MSSITPESDAADQALGSPEALEGGFWDAMLAGNLESAEEIANALYARVVPRTTYKTWAPNLPEVVVRVWDVSDTDPLRYQIEVTLEEGRVTYGFSRSLISLMVERRASGGRSGLWRLWVTHLFLGYCAKEWKGQRRSTFLNLADVPRAHGGLAFSGSPKDHTLIPDPFFVQGNAYSRLRGKSKEFLPYQDRAPMFFWRGSSSGASGNIYGSQRYQMCQMALEAGDSTGFDLAISSITRDVAANLTENEIQGLKARGILRGGVPFEDFAKCKYHIDVDGNSNSWGGLFSKLVIGAAIVKVGSRGGYSQWYYDRLEEGKNVLWVKGNLEDFFQKTQMLKSSQFLGETLAGGAFSLVEDMTLENEFEKSAMRIRIALK